MASDGTKLRCVSAVVLTKNESRNVSELIPVLLSCGLRVLVVDSHSTDDTVSAAVGSGAAVVCNQWIDYSTQFNYGIQCLGRDVEWVLRVDADERPSVPMQNFLKQFVLGDVPVRGVTGFSFPLGIWFMGKRLRFGGLTRIRQLRLFSAGVGRCEALKMDEHIKLSFGRCEDRKEILEHFAVEDYVSWINKHVGYAKREVQDSFDAFSQQVAGGELPKGHPAYWRRMAKVRLYYRCPKFSRALLLWMFRYFVLAGFLDGTPGFVYHLFQCLWYRSMVDLLRWESEMLTHGSLAYASRAASSKRPVS
jgi:glycosyltransferase involved in cell wall biosynthesis